MNLKKHSFALITGFLFLLVAGGVGYLLFTSRGKFVEAKGKLDSAEGQFKQLSNGTPYPSNENVEVEKENLERMLEFYSDLEAYLCAGQLQAVPMESAEFPERLEDMYRDLRKSATNRSIRLPPDFYFGFDAYVDQLPAAEDVPRLTIQAQVVEQLCSVLFSNKVSTIETIKREIFEKNLGTTGGNAMRSMGGFGGFDDFSFSDSMEETTSLDEEDEGNGLYKTEHVEILFTARDEHLWNVINALGSNKLFSVITRVEIESSGSGIESGSNRMMGERMSRPMGLSDFGRGEFGGMEDRYGGGRNSMRPMRRSPEMSRQGVGGEEAIVLPHEDRLVAGREERATVQLGLDVYRFCLQDEAAEDEALDEDLFGSEEEENP